MVLLRDIYLLSSLLTSMGLLGYDQSIYKSGAATYTFSGGRFGDNVWSYLHAKWLSYKYNIPLLYKPFQCSDLLRLHTRELRYAESEVRKFTKVIDVSKTNCFDVKVSAGTLYVVPFFTETVDEPENIQRKGPLFYIDWHDQNFIDLVRQLVAPVFDMPKIQVPPGYLSVLVHVRKASGLDPLISDEPGRIPRPGVRYSDVFLPLKHLPDEYYVEQIKRLYLFHNKQPLYVYIMCDRNTPEVVHSYREKLKDLNLLIEGDIWKKSNTNNPVFDFFLMMQFDCMIRSESNLSMIASKLGNFLTVVSPVGFHRANDYAPLDTLWVSFNSCVAIRDGKI